MNALGFNERGGRPQWAHVRSMPILVFPALCAALYPLWLSGGSSLIRTSHLTGGAAISVATSFALLTAVAVMLVSFATVRVVDGAIPRVLSHLAFTTPTLIVALGNFAAVLNIRGYVMAIWLILWLVLAAAALIFPESDFGMLPLKPLRRARLASAHGVSACAIIALFIAPHLSNHLAGLWSGSTHIAVMKALRLMYRNEIIEPLLFALIAFQILSGLTLVGNRMGRPHSFFGTMQSMTGLYVAVFFLGHVTAVVAARHAGTDTNWNWLTGNDKGLLASLRSISLVGHYWVGPIAIMTHIACGIRAILLQHRVSPSRANRLAIGMMGVAVVISSSILAGLIGIHLHTMLG